MKSSADAVAVEAKRQVRLIFGTDGLGALFGVLQQSGHELIGPTVREGAIAYDSIRGLNDLPRGWTDAQEPGRYAIRPGDCDALFGYTMAPQSWKRILFPPSRCLFRAPLTDRHAKPEQQATPPRALALIGVRACELAAIRILDRVLLGGQHADPAYRAVRDQTFIVAVNCTRAAATCFCHSLDNGPRAGDGYDVALTELVSKERHEFLAEAGSERGAEMLGRLDAAVASDDFIALADEAILRAAAEQTRWVNTDGIRELLYSSLESPRWDEVAERCLTCGNCTMVCPTCFCTTTTDSASLDGSEASRDRQWDSCFSKEYSYIHGGSVRTTSRARYRQWMTHKLAFWFDQFGTAGCVGCGRCITWCPSLIDITEEAHALAQTKESHHGGN